MNPGDLRHRVVAQIPVIVQNPDGYEEEVYQDFMHPWAKVENLYGREYFAAMSAKVENTIKIFLRYSKDIDTIMRILFNGKSYYISFIDNIKYGNKALELKCIEALYKTCTIYRYAAVKDELNRPKQTLNKVGIYQCINILKASSYIQGTPQAVSDESFMLMGTKNMKVQVGDLVEIDGIRYVAGMPTSILDRHIKVELTAKKDV